MAQDERRRDLWVSMVRTQLLQHSVTISNNRIRALQEPSIAILHCSEKFIRNSSIKQNDMGMIHVQDQ